MNLFCLNRYSFLRNVKSVIIFKSNVRLYYRHFTRNFCNYIICMLYLYWVSIFKIPKNTYKECHFFLSPQNYSNNNELSLQENVVYLNTDVWLIQLKRKSFWVNKTLSHQKYHSLSIFYAWMIVQHILPTFRIS